MNLNCSRKLIYLKQELNCSISVDSKDELFWIEINFGDGDKTVVELNDSSTLVVKSYQALGEYIITAEAKNHSLSAKQEVSGNSNGLYILSYYLIRICFLSEKF